MDYQRISAVLLGNATQDAALKTAKASGHSYADFRLGVRNRQGNPTFFPIRSFGKLAEGAPGIKKGAKVLVDGELEISSFAGDEGGKRMMFRVLATTYRLLGNGRQTAAAEEPGPA
jgi:single-strand DNA-binding protein